MWFSIKISIKIMFHSLGNKFNLNMLSNLLYTEKPMFTVTYLKKKTYVQWALRGC